MRRVAGVDAAVGGKEGLLGQILGCMVVLGQLVADGVDQFFVCYNQLFKFFLCHVLPGSPPSKRLYL